jgi:hypothetical protein
MDECERNPDPALISLVEESRRNVTNTRRGYNIQAEERNVSGVRHQLTGSIVPDEDTSEASQADDGMPP